MLERDRRELITEELDDSGRGTNTVINPFHYFRSQSSQLSLDDKGPHSNHATPITSASSSSLPGAPSSSSIGASATEPHAAVPGVHASSSSEHASTGNIDRSSSAALASASAASTPYAIDFMQGLFALAKDEMGKLMAAMPGGPPKGPAPHRKPHESMDFEDTESRGWRKDKGKRFKSSTVTTAWKWILLVVLAIITGCCGAFVKETTIMLGTFKFQSVNALIAKNQWAGAYFLHQFICVLYASIAMGCCWHFEAAAGSGIPEIKAFLNGVNLKQFVRSRVLLAKLVGMCFSVASGIPTGKKGPIIHIGASLGAVVSQGGRTLGFDASWQQFQDLRNDKSKRDFVTYGIAAGVASMFRSPIGGVLFALEEGASFWSSTLTFRAFFCAMMTLFTVSILLTDGNFGTADSSSLFVFGQFHDLELGRTNYRMYELFIFILMGVSGGVIGALWNAMVKRLTVYYMKNYTEKRQKAMRVLIFAFAMGSIAFFMPLMWQVCSKKPSGDDIADWGAEELQLLDKLVAFQCPEGYYNQVASLFFTGGEDAIRQLYHFREYMGSSYSTFDAGPLLLFMIPYGIMMSSTAGLFVPLGLFVPSLLLGAAYGRLWGHVLNTLFPGYVADSGTYAMMGSCAINGGITRMTISMTIIMLETAGNMTYLLPLMVTFGAARYTGNALGPGIYDIQLALKEFPFLESSLHTLGLLNYNPVTEIMSSPVVTFQEIEKVGNIVRALKSTTHNGYPVVEMNGKLRGLIPRKILTSLLNWKAFSAPESGSILRSASSRRFSVASEAEALPDNAIQLAPPATTVFYDSVEKQYPNYPAIESIELSEEEMNLWLDLRPYMDTACYTINSSASILRTHREFRTMGLRHIVVIDGDHVVVGIVTRRDITDKKLRSIWEQEGDNIEKKINVAAMPPGIVYEGGRPGFAPEGKSKAAPRRWPVASRTLGSCDEEDAEGEDECTVASATGAGEDEDTVAGQDEGASVASSIEAAMAETLDTAASPLHVKADGSALPVRPSNLSNSSTTAIATAGDATSTANLSTRKSSSLPSLFESVMQNLEGPSLLQGPDSVSPGAAGAGISMGTVPEAALSASSYAFVPAVAPEDSWLDMILMPKREVDSESRDKFFRDDDRIEDEDSPEFDLMPSGAASSGYGSTSSSSAGVGAIGTGALSGASRYAPLSSADPSSSAAASSARWSVGRGALPRR